MFCWVVERKLWQGILGVVGLAAVAWGIVALGGDTLLGRFALRSAGEVRLPVEERDVERTDLVRVDVGIGTDPAAADEGAVPAWAEARPGEPVTVDLWSLVPAEEGEGDGNADLTAAASGFPDTIAASGLPDIGLSDTGVAGTGFPRIDGPVSGPLYEAFRLERDRLHARQVEAIERAFTDPEVAEERRWESHMLMLEMLAAREREVELEYMLRAGGYPDAVVAVRGDYANVVVEGVLDEQGASRIGELVVRVAGIAPERIAIVDGYSGP